MTYATLNKKSPNYPWLRDLLRGERVPLVSDEPADLDQLSGLTDQVSYIVALDRFTREQQDGLVGRYAQENDLTPMEVEYLFAMLGGCPIPAETLMISARARNESSLRSAAR